jgi:hypothetical protein
MEFDDFAACLIVVIIIILYIKNNYNRNFKNNQRECALIFYNLINKRKMEIFLNIRDHSILKLELEASLFVIEAKKLNLFPDEILKKLFPYTNINLYSEIKKSVAEKEIVELEAYFIPFIK